MYLLCMIKARIRWCTCRVENILTLGKLLSLWFCFLLHSILFLISQTSYRTYKIISSNELARPVMGTIFLVRDSLLAKITRGISIGLGHLVAITTRINTQALMCSQIIHRENLLHTSIYLYRVIISNDENYSVG